jgi:CHAT domain-containing protein
LEEHAFAVVPHGAFLLEHLKAAPEPPRKGDLLLAVGAVAYGAAAGRGRQPQESDAPPGADAPGSPGGAPPPKQLNWPALAGTARELDQVTVLAKPRPVLARRGTEAGTDQVLTDLPRARWAHLATHGFFADARFRSFLQTDEYAFARGWQGERSGPGARSPLVLSGLVLAGANRQHEDGVLTGEAIAGLNLERLELAVLSACETGLVEEGGGEGVFGLQRAFHLAGTRNVVASLWKVDDEATTALMALFYHKYWQEKLPPLEALRQAQLTLYRHPERLPVLARARGPEFEKAVVLPVEAHARRAPARLWAGFVLSGAGR